MSYVKQIQRLDTDSDGCLRLADAVRVASEADDEIAQLHEGIIAEIVNTTRWKDRYMREVEGQNNEGDGIGGEPPYGLRHRVEDLQAKFDGLREFRKCLIGYIEGMKSYVTLESDVFTLKQVIQKLDELVPPPPDFDGCAACCSG